MKIPLAGRPLVTAGSTQTEAGLRPGVAGATETQSATSNAESFERRPGLVTLRRQRTISAATSLTAADLALPPGPPAVSAKGIVTDALELLRESGVSPIKALSVASARLGLETERGVLWGFSAWESLGPSVLPLMPWAEVPEMLGSWSLRLGDVLPALHEHAQTSPQLYPERLAALAANPSLTDADAMALHDVRVRTELGGTPVLTVDDGLTLASVVETAIGLPDGPLLGDSVVLVRRLLDRGHQADPVRVQALADRALGSNTLSARANAGQLFWRSSFATEAGLKAYLTSVLAVDSEPWSTTRLKATAEALELDSTWSKPATMVDEATAKLVMSGLLRGAPAQADVGPIAEALMWPAYRGRAWVQLADEARAAVEWSSSPLVKRIAAADTLRALLHEGLGEPAFSRRASRLLVRLLGEGPSLAHAAPRLLRAQIGSKADAAALERLAKSTDYLGELRLMRAALEALDDSARAARLSELRAIDEVLRPPTRENTFEALLTSSRELAEVKADELGISNQELFDAVVSRSPDYAGQLLPRGGLSEETYRTHLVKMLLAGSKSDTQEAALAPLATRRLSKEGVVDVLQQGHRAGLWSSLGVSLLKAGFSRPLVSALTASPTDPPPLQVLIEPSNEPVRGLSEIRRARAADFRARVAGEAPSSGVATRPKPAGEIDEVDLASLSSAVDERAAARAALSLVSRERLEDGDRFASAVQALLKAGPPSLDFLAPSLVAAFGEGAPGFRLLDPLAELMLSPRLSKAAALELAWAVAESSNPLSSHRPVAKDLGLEQERQLEHAINALLRFSDERADLTGAERVELKRAVGSLEKNLPPPDDDDD